MKQLLTIMIVISLVCSVSAQDSTSQAVRVFVGAEYDSGEKVFVNTVGSVQHLIGGLYAVERVVIGQYGSLETDIMWKMDFQNSDFSIGILAGPNTDFIGAEGDGLGPTAYIVGGAGMVASWMPACKPVGMHAASKYKFSFDQGSLYQDGFQFGLFLSYQFSN